MSGGLNSMPSEVLEKILMLTAVDWATKHPNYEVVLATLAAVDKRCRQIVKEERFRHLFLKKLFAVDPVQRYKPAESCVDVPVDGLTDEPSLCTVLGDELFVVDGRHINVYDVSAIEQRTRASVRRLTVKRRMDIPAIIELLSPDDSFIISSAFNNCLYLCVPDSEIEFWPIYRLSAIDGQLMASWKPRDVIWVGQGTASQKTGDVLIVGPAAYANGAFLGVIQQYSQDGTLMIRIDTAGILDGMLFERTQAFPAVDLGGPSGAIYVATTREGYGACNETVVMLVEDEGTWMVRRYVDLPSIDGGVFQDCFSPYFRCYDDSNGCLIVVRRRLQRYDQFIDVIDSELRHLGTFNMCPMESIDGMELDRRRGRLLCLPWNHGDAMKYLDLWRDVNGVRSTSD